MFDTNNYYTLDLTDLFTEEEKPHFNFGGGYVVNGKTVYIEKVIYRRPATIVFWSDNTVTRCKSNITDSYSPEGGLAICVLKKLTGNAETKALLNDWAPANFCKPDAQQVVTIQDVRKRVNK